MPILHLVKAFNQQTNLAQKTCLVVGGTSGIGEGIAHKLAALNARVMIAGRNKEAAFKVISEMSNPDKHSFLPIDMCSVKDVNRFCSEFTSNNDKLDYLVITAGMMSVNGRDESEDGIDKKLQVHYYSRFLIILRLIPLLLKAQNDGHEVRVMSVLAACKALAGPPLDDLGLKTHYSIKRASDVGPLYNDLMVETFSKKFPSLSFVHIYPGFVNTNLINNLPAVLRYPAKALSYFGKSIHECAEFMTYALLNKEYSQGWFLLSEKGDRLNPTSFQTDDLRGKVVEHTKQCLSIGNEI